MDKDELWQATLAEVELSLSKANFVTWFKNTSILSKKDGVVLISVPNAFNKEWLENKYNRLVLKILRNLTPDAKEIRFTIKSQFPEQDKKAIVAKKREPLVVLLDQQLNLSENITDKETNLNPRYTFESFVVGSFNELAHAAAVGVSKGPGKVYNPFFIYGGVGLGKTHLLQAIGNEILKNDNKKRIKYLSSEKFLGELISSIKNKVVDKFKDEYKKIDVLIIDDIQFLAGKEKTQEEFFHIFNTLYEKNNQIILSSDRPPKAMTTLEERLKSRFEGGMIADITNPDYETRLAILKSKVIEKGMEPPSDDILSFIASSVTKNIRELEGALNRIVASSRLTGFTPTLEKVKAALANLNNNNRPKTTPKNVIKVVSEFYGVKEEDLITPSRKREIVRPRQICMYIIREELKNSYPFIGEKFGGRDHTTVMHACDKIGREIQSSESLNEEINLIKTKIYEV